MQSTECFFEMCYVADYFHFELIAMIGGGRHWVKKSIRLDNINNGKGEFLKEIGKLY